MAERVRIRTAVGAVLRVEAVAEDEPCYVISVAARMVGVHAQTLRTYERTGLMDPARSRGNIRMYSPHDLQRARWIRSLIDDLGINLAGVEVIMRMKAQMDALEGQVQSLAAELNRGRGGVPGREG
ncbi:MAG: MerR family transcriptional regulator [Chloroflexi bacterium]|nr:MerR family transcriptional regulator [Chloroflexota bacterium]MCH7656323.1 MerR family transcriptional regulator [Chloroflexota bacterium]